MNNNNDKKIILQLDVKIAGYILVISQIQHIFVETFTKFFEENMFIDLRNVYEKKCVRCFGKYYFFNLSFKKYKPNILQIKYKGFLFSYKA